MKFTTDRIGFSAPGLSLRCRPAAQGQRPLALVPGRQWAMTSMAEGPACSLAGVLNSSQDLVGSWLDESASSPVVSAIEQVLSSVGRLHACAAWLLQLRLD